MSVISHGKRLLPSVYLCVLMSEICLFMAVTVTEVKMIFMAFSFVSMSWNLCFNFNTFKFTT